MTVIAWDGVMLAADKLGDAGGMRRTATKIRRLSNGMLFASAGTASRSRAMMEWIALGAQKRDIPAFQLTEEYQDTFVVHPDGSVWVYTMSTLPFEMVNQFHAIGSGRAYAMAAMYLGCTAEKAVRVASEFDMYCGNGVDVLRLDGTDA